MDNPQYPVDQPSVVRAWTMYDWANSVYNLVITTTFFPIYFLAVTRSAYGEDTVPFLGRIFKNSSLYQYTLSISYLSIALLLPILSSIADSRGSRKRFLQIFCYLGGLGCMGMFFFKGSHPSVEWGLFCFVCATVGYCGSLVFYNSYLPQIASVENQDRVSAQGYAMGYVGSVILQSVGFGLVIYFGSKGDQVSGPIYTFLLVGLWWIGFAQFTFRGLPPSPAKILRHSVWVDGFVKLRHVWERLKTRAVIKWYLVAFWFYSMGVQTVLLAATMFGQKTLGLPSDKLIITIVLIQIVAIAGAFIMSRLSRTFGNLNVLMGVVFFWAVVCVSAYQVANLKEAGYSAEYYFYGLAVGVGLVMGGIQALSRSTYSKLMPETSDTASFFSFYDVTEKTAIVIGTFSFGYIDELFGMKNSVLALIVFFVLGFAGLVITRMKSSQTNRAVVPSA
jgi:UMF1 family MFS transporter